MNQQNRELVQKALALSESIPKVKPFDFSALIPSIDDILKPYRDMVRLNAEWISRISDPFMQMKQLAELLTKTVGTPEQTVRKLVEGLRVSFDSAQLIDKNVTLNEKANEVIFLVHDKDVPNDSHLQMSRTTEVRIELDKHIDFNTPPKTLRGLVRRVVFIKQTSYLVFNGMPPIKIMENTPMFSLCRLLFGRIGNMGKKWSAAEIKERIGDNDPQFSHVTVSSQKADRIRGGSGKKRERQVPDAIRYLNKRIGKKDFILCNNNWVVLNPRYHEYYK